MRGDRHVILVVDDDVESLEVIAQNLRRMGYEVVPAVDGRSAVEMVRQGEVDLAVVDYNLPDLDGLQVLKMIKRINSALPVIVMSAASTNHNLLFDLLDAGAYAFIPKPICVPDFQRTIERALASSYPSEPESDGGGSIFFRWRSWIIRRG